jgi:hypothetical protein
MTVTEPNMARRPSGLIVPAALALVPRKTDGQPTQDSGTAYDLDGRRRVVLTRADQRTVDRAIRILQACGLGIIVGCRGEKRPDGTDACGLPMLNEDPGTLDSGYGCKCTRLHFTR